MVESKPGEGYLHTDQIVRSFQIRKDGEIIEFRDGDAAYNQVVVIKSLDRLSRNKEHITQELRYFKEHHIQVRVIDLPTTMIQLPTGQEWVFEMINNILIEVLSSIAEQERLTIRQRQAEGIAAAKAKGNIWAGQKSNFLQIGTQSTSVGSLERSQLWLP